MKELHVGIQNEIKTINEAISLINEPTIIFLDDENYYEKVVVNKENIIIDGQNKARIYYDDYAIKIHTDGREYVTFRTYTCLVKAKNVTLRNLTIENTAGPGYLVGQAVALHTYNDNIHVENCHLKAYQDTLFCGPFSDDLVERYIDLLPEDERVHDGDYYVRFDNCTIEGTVDFIFGAANVDFNNCTIISLKADRLTWVSAPSHKETTEYGFHFNNCRLLKGEGVEDKSVSLGRPWRDYGITVYKNCYLDSHIIDEGFTIWEGTDRHKHARLEEINSYGPGRNNKARIYFAKAK